MQHDVRLLRTPLPVPGESYWGYILRLSAENALDSPIPLLTLGDFSKYEHRLSQMGVDLLVNLTGHDQQIFEKISYRHLIEDHTQLNGHPLTQNYQRTKLARLCPACVQETGFIHAFWDIAQVDVCPVHEVYLIEACTTCEDELNWHRPELLKCACGADIQMNRSDKKPTAESLEFQKAIWAVVNGTRLRDADSKSGMPYESLTNMSLQSLLGIAHSLGSLQLHMHGQVKDVRACTDHRELDTAALIFSDWPKNFHALLDQYGHHFAKEAIGFTRQFAGFVSRIFKMGYAESDVHFLKLQFTLFGRDHWRKAEVRESVLKRLGLESKREWVNVTQYARLVGAVPPTLRGSMDQHWLETEIIGIGGKQKRLISLKDGKRMMEYKADVVSVRNASKMLGLPASVLLELRKSGHYKVTEYAYWSESFTMTDMNIFFTRLMSLQRYSDDMPQDLIKLGSVMAMKLSMGNLKARILMRIIDMNFPVYGPAAQITDLLVSKQQIDHLATELRLEGTECLIRDAAKMLDLHFYTVQGLYNAKLIKGRSAAYGIWLNIQSVEKFGQQYVALAKLAKERGTNSPTLLNICKQKGIEVKMVPRFAGMPQPFIKNEHINQL